MLSSSLKNNPQLDRWIKFNKDQTVTIFTGKVEIGQKLSSALSMIAAEELSLDFDRIIVNKVSTSEGPDEQYTVGSNSIEESGAAIRQVSARVKEILYDMASDYLSETISDISLKDGTFSSRLSNKTVTFWELMADNTFNSNLEKMPTLKSYKDYNIIGSANLSKGFQEIVCGKAVYVHDLELPNMLHARVIRPPTYKSRLVDYDFEKVKTNPGVIHIEHNGSFLAVAAEREEQAVKAAGLIKRKSKWSNVEKNISNENLLEQHQSNIKESYPVIDGLAQQNSFQPSKNNNENIIKANYLKPYHMHGSIGPSSAAALFDGSSYKVWTSSQGIYPLRDAISEVLEISKDLVNIEYVPGAGCYGHNGADDAALDAVLLARSIIGRPILLKWEREDEHSWEPYGSSMYIEMEGSLDNNGKVNYWGHNVYSDVHNARPKSLKGASNLLASWHLERPMVMPKKEPWLVFHGGIHRNADPIYSFSNKNIVKTLVRDLPLRVSALRSLGAFGNIFALESFVDELASTQKIDPLTFRLNHLEDNRAKEVLEEVALIANWGSSQKTPNYGRGISMARYKNMKCYAAVIVDLHVDDYGNIKLKQAYIAADSGQIIDKEGVKSQLEGGFIQAASWTLKEEVKYDESGITSKDWDTYPIIKFPEIPNIKTTLLDRPEQPFLGSGEATQGPTSAAIGNAIFDAIEVRLRTIPFTPENLRSAVSEL